MKRLLSLLVFLFFAGHSYSQNNLNRFSGFHFDFHATLNDSAMGETITEQMIDSFLTITRPDFIQVDCKGHPGIASYPTNIGTHPAGIQKDILALFRKVTARHGVKLYVHYSGILDHQAVALHSSWSRINADNKRDENATSVFGNYVDSLMIPQLKELAEKYKIDGAWVDGDCWALAPDYSQNATNSFKQQTGFSSVPTKPGDPHYFEWAEYNRKGFRDYVTHYVNALHQSDPAFHITSNWSFSSMMPEKVSIPVDFLSGDVAGENSMYNSSFQSRCMALQGKPWDLMSWSFSWKGDGIKATKPVSQIEQEAAEVLAMGGGFQTYWQQNRDGSLETYQFQKMAEIIQFCNDRKPYCFRGKVVPQIGLLYSTYTWRRLAGSNLYNGSGANGLKSILNLLMDNQLPVEILMDHQLAGRLTDYPLIIIPEWPFLDPDIQKQLTAYVKQGGNLLIIGATAVQPFKPLLNVTFLNPPGDTSVFAAYNNEVISIKTKFQPVKARTEAVTTGITLEADDFRFPTGLPLASVTSLGKGKIAALYMDISNEYDHFRSPFLKEIVNNLVLQLFPNVKVRIQGSQNIHTVISGKNRKLYIHLINTDGQHNNPNVMTYDEVMPIHNIRVQIHLDKKPKAIILQPAHKALTFQYEKGVASLSLDTLKIYDILEVEE